MRLILIFILFFSSSSFANCQSRLNRKRAFSLTRDRMPEIFAREGSLVEVRKATPVQYAKLLFKKLEEEMNELNEDPSVEELADVKEVVLTIAKYFRLDEPRRIELNWFIEDAIRKFGFEDDDVESARLEKRAKKGGFERGFMIRAIPARQRALLAQEAKADSGPKTKDSKK